MYAYSVHHEIVLLILFTLRWLQKHLVTMESVTGPTSLHLFIPFLECGGRIFQIFIIHVIVNNDFNNDNNDHVNNEINDN